MKRLAPLRRPSSRDTPVLPIDGLKNEIREALELGPVVISSPTGSGKSTQVPRWCPGPVLVVEPRRVACRSLALRVAELEGCALGEDVGYSVRDENRARPNTRILFATPGVVLRLGARLDSYATVVLDEFHERGLDVDLLLALLLARRRRGRSQGRLVVMSATLDGDRLATYLGGRHLHAEGRLHPVEIEHLPEGALLPDVRGLESRVRRALDASRERPGDVLVFLPGKGEIASCANALRTGSGAEILELHGGLTLEEQGRAFRPSPKRKVILATNVAETSITLPGIGVVIDSGLVRRTRYHRDRGFLTLAAVAQDSADQRVGRAGRTGPGIAFRLWDSAARLEERTPPEVERESLVPLVLAAAALGESAADLPFLDPPPKHALETASLELGRLGALDADGGLSARGRELFGLPIDAALGRLLVEGQEREVAAPGILDDMIDLVSVLGGVRELWRLEPAEVARESTEASGDVMAAACDACAAIRVLRRGHVSGGRALAEARRLQKRLRRAYGRDGKAPAELSIDRRRLAAAVLGADPRNAHVARRRGRRIAWASGGAEIELGRSSTVHRLEEDIEAIAVLATRALAGQREARLLATCAMPLPLEWLVEAGLGRDRLGALRVERAHGAPRRVVAEIERVHARRVLTMREEVPSGELARQAVTELFLAGRLFRESLETTRDRLAAAALARRLAQLTAGPWAGTPQATMALEAVPEEVPGLEDWAARRVEELGVESGEDVELLSPKDLLVSELPAYVASELDREFPRTLEILGTTYAVSYEVGRGEAILRQAGGRLKHQVPPLFALPRLAGFRVRIEHRGALKTLRE